ncbi:L-amino-acid oxidase [Hondaea fermentalgiana]|uniref:L-amino-acid oxidase n=1 Tax=Hondaea fermentalgiana TaxID=2315210 RepID=A0A2R5GN12_9STRA|nr:L-amino-acid oxidase [Hondaea fermentalgiana]|eukprot:GBG32005.1 L-amino-acid oxidase [Hondaea fermentalgiana]
MQRHAYEQTARGRSSAPVEPRPRAGLLSRLSVLRKRVSKRRAARKAQSLLGENDYEVVIVGGGFSGAYCAYELRKEFPELKVVILEGDNDLGGRLFSDDNDDNPYNMDELGGMRIFPSVQPRVAEMVTEMGCDLVPVKLEDSSNLFYYEGKRVRKGDFRLTDCGLTPKDFLQRCYDAYEEAMPEDAARPPLEREELCMLSLPAFLEKYGASRADIKEFFSYSGYDIFSDESVAASVFVQEGILYGPELDEDQHYVREGFEEVVKRMAKASEAEVRLNAKVSAIAEPDAEGFSALSVRENGAPVTLRAKRVIIGLPQDAAMKLAKRSPALTGERLDLICNAVKLIPLFKVFLEFDLPDSSDVWWREAGFKYGKSTTDLEVRQIHYYDREDLLCYASGKYAEYWDREFRANWRNAAHEVYDQIKDMHGEHAAKAPEPIWDNTIFRFWNNGSHKWRKGVEIGAALHTICHGGTSAMEPSQSPILLVGDAFSTQQGWVAGAIETSDLALVHVKAGLRVMQ